MNLLFNFGEILTDKHAVIIYAMIILILFTAIVICVIVKETEKDDMSVSIKNATLHEQNVFNTAIKELLSPIDNPRYIIIKKGVFKKFCRIACACILYAYFQKIVGCQKHYT